METRLKDLSKEELLDLLYAYNDYVIYFYDEHEVGMQPVSIFEYYDNDYKSFKEYEQMIIEWVETEYQNIQDRTEYNNIMKHIHDIVFNIYQKISDNIILEEEMGIIWKEIDRWK